MRPFPSEARLTTRKNSFLSLFSLYFSSFEIFFLARARQSQKFAYVTLIRYMDGETLVGGGGEEWENYPSGSVSAPWYLKAIRPIVTQRDKFEVRRLAWRTWHGWIRSNCVMPFWHRVIIKTFHLGRHIASRCPWTDPLAHLPFTFAINSPFCSSYSIRVTPLSRNISWLCHSWLYIYIYLKFLNFFSSFSFKNIQYL